MGGGSWNRLAELEGERQEVIGELADMSPEGWTLTAGGCGRAARTKAQQYVQGLHQLGLGARAREAELERRTSSRRSSMSTETRSTALEREVPELGH